MRSNFRVFLCDNQAPNSEQSQMNKIGYNIKKIRELNGWTQEQLVARLNLIEWDISRGTLAKIESKRRKLSDYEVELLAKALEVNIERLYEIKKK